MRKAYWVREENENNELQTDLLSYVNDSYEQQKREQQEKRKQEEKKRKRLEKQRKQDRKDSIIIFSLAILILLNIAQLV